MRVCWMRPVVLIPGMFGSILEDKSGHKVWPGDSLPDMFHVKNNFINGLSGTTHSDLDFVNWVDREVDSVPGVEGVDRLLKTPTLKFLNVKLFDYFDEIIQALKAEGYVEGESLFAYSYDFRQSAANPKQMERFEVFLQSIPKDPILIVHSMGGMIVRYFQHMCSKWMDYFRSVISINVCYDGGNGKGIMDTVNGYNMGNPLLNDCTAGIYATSGLTATIYGSASSLMPTYTLYFKRRKQRKGSRLLVKEDCSQWYSVRLLGGAEYQAYYRVLEHVISDPCTVCYNVSYWIRRFQRLFRRNLQIIGNLKVQNSLPYTRLCIYQHYLFKSTYQQTKSDEEYELIYCVMWWNSTKFPFPTCRDRNAPEAPLQQRPKNIFLYQTSVVTGLSLPQQAKESFFLHEMTYFPIECTEKMSLLDFYDQYQPEGTLEHYVFGINYPLFLKHYEARHRYIEWPTNFQFVSISSHGILTPRDCYFEHPVDDIYELRFYRPRGIYGDGDGTVLLVSQLDDCVPKYNVCERMSFRGVGHKEILQHYPAVQHVVNWVKRFSYYGSTVQ